jgi:hypothetical protein
MSILWVIAMVAIAAIVVVMDDSKWDRTKHN